MFQKETSALIFLKIPPKHWYLSINPHGDTLQNTIISTLIAVKASSLINKMLHIRCINTKENTKAI